MTTVVVKLVDSRGVLQAEVHMMIASDSEKMMVVTRRGRVRTRREMICEGQVGGIVGRRLGVLV